MMVSEKRLKICFAGWGHSIHTRRYCEWFAKRGHTCFLLTDHIGEMIGVSQIDIRPPEILGPRWKRFMHGNIRIRYWQDLRIFLRVRRVLKKLRPNILHLHTLIHPNELIALASVGFSIPVVTMPWNGDLLWLLDRPWWQRKIIPWLVCRSKLGLYNSEALRQAMIEYGLNENKLLSYLGVDINYFNTNACCEDFITSLGLDRNCPIVLSPRSLGDFYRIDLIVKSIALVREKVPNVLYVFCWHAGSSQQEEALKKLIDEQGVGSSILILGKQSQEASMKLYRAARVIVSMSEKDSMPSSMLEAMACGSVPIVAQHPSVCELALNEDTAIVVPQGDHVALAEAIIRLLVDSVLRIRLSRNARKLVETVADQDRNLSIIERRYYEIVYGKDFA